LVGVAQPLAAVLPGPGDARVARLVEVAAPASPDLELQPAVAAPAVLRGDLGEALPQPGAQVGAVGGLLGGVAEVHRLLSRPPRGWRPSWGRGRSRRAPWRWPGRGPPWCRRPG